MFSHSHIINGVTIVHSHPFNKGTSDKPINHQHSEKEYSLIQLLSDFSTTPAVVLTGLSILLCLLQEMYINRREENHLNLSPKCSYSLRAPPSNKCNQLV
jgi:hypothetical protein